ncbi:MAG TPA: hypothetical protein VKE94_00535, partial [Gemmataceae bacterium]|nr:hypothetical protein [Gemmataceae bacterium]
PSASYRLRKLAHRYRAPILVAGAFVFLLALGAIVAAWQAVRATAAEKMAKRAELEANQERLAALVAKQHALEAKTAHEANLVPANESGSGSRAPRRRNMLLTED